ncbi:MAG: zinc ABC transporter substrate-binding protein [Tissierellia bacterium]|nr:zinc ABC transporter substrate-binding protein [Tissierellia bacterium]
MKNNIIKIIVLFLIFALMTTSCMKNEENVNSKDEITIVASLFPQYDFAKTIAGDRAKVLLLTPPGVDTHSFEPSPGDIINIENSDVFIYTGKYMEPWAETLLASTESTKLLTVDVSKGVELDKEHHEHDEEADHGHHHEYDPHIWTNPVFAKKMVQNITDALVEVDPVGKDIYIENSNKLIEEIEKINQGFIKAVSEGQRKDIFFGSRFALHYLVKEYGLHAHSVFNSCSEETEPSVASMTEIVEAVKSQSIPVIFYQELEEPKVALTIAEETGAEPLLFHSAHNVSKDDFNNGISWVKLMEDNIENLKKALN